MKCVDQTGRPRGLNWCACESARVVRQQTIFVAGIIAALLFAAPARAQFQSGDLLVSEYVQSTGAIQRYDATGALQQTLTGTGSGWAGAALTPGGNVVTTYDIPASGVNIYNPVGTEIASFTTPAVSFPGDVSVFPDGLLAINDQSGARTRLYTQAGVLSSTITLPAGAVSPFGNTISPIDHSLWVADFGSKHLYDMTEGGVTLHNLTLTFKPADVIVDPKNSTLWITDRINNRLYNLSATGGVIQNFAVSGDLTTGIALAADGSLYESSFNSGEIFHYTGSGTPIDEITTTGPGAPSFITIIPEPGTLALLALGGMVLLRRSRRESPRSSGMA